MKKLLLSAICLLSIISVTAQFQTFKWAKGLGGGLNDGGSRIITDASGNVYTAGQFEGTADFDPGVGVFNLISAGDVDIYISKLDATGNFAWAKRIGGSLFDEANSIKLDGAGNIFLAGVFTGMVDMDPGAATFNLTSAGMGDMFILKLDATGNFSWAKRTGGTGEDGARDLVRDAAGNIFATGWYQGTVDFDPGAGTSNFTAGGLYDIFISKYDASGNFTWTKSMGGTSTSDNGGFWISLDASGNIYVSGSFSLTVDFDPGAGVFNLTSFSNFDTYIVKLNSSGNFVWAGRYGGYFGDYPSGMAVDATGNIYLSGSFQDSVDFNPGTGTFYLSSTFTGSPFTVASDPYILKLDPAGNFIWAKNFGGPTADYCHGMTLDAQGNAYLVGNFRVTTDFDPSSAVSNLTSKGSWDAYVVKFNSAGNFVWASQMGGASFDAGIAVTVDAQNTIYTTGNFNGTADFDPTASVFNLISLGSGDAFVNKISQAGTGIDDHTTGTTTGLFTVYPNPTNGEFNLILAASPEANTSLEIYNNLGALVYKQASVNKINTMDLTSQSGGLYFVKLINEDKIIFTQKVIKR